jgi:hypothetical protein
MKDKLADLKVLNFNNKADCGAGSTSYILGHEIAIRAGVTHNPRSASCFFNINAKGRKSGIASKGIFGIDAATDKYGAFAPRRNDALDLDRVWILHDISQGAINCLSLLWRERYGLDRHCPQLPFSPRTGTARQSQGHHDYHRFFHATAPKPIETIFARSLDVVQSLHRSFTMIFPIAFVCVIAVLVQPIGWIGDRSPNCKGA